MRNKYFVKCLSIGSVVVLPLLCVGCSTTWMRWRPGEDKETKFEFIRQKEDEIKYKMRDLEILRLAYEPDKEVLDLSKLNNHHELMALLGDITNLKFAKGQTLEKFWKEKSWEKNLWSDEKTGFFDKITKKLSFAIKYKHDISEKVELDLEAELEGVIKGFQSFKFNNEKFYDLEDAVNNGLIKIDDMGVPEEWVNFPKLFILDEYKQKKMLDLIDIDSIFSLTAYSANAAGRLSKLINFPNKSFEQFVELMEKIDKFIKKIWNNNVNQKWIFSEKINLEINEEGYIVKNVINDLESLFEAKFIIYLLF